jgi:hypothetical protein
MKGIQWIATAGPLSCFGLLASLDAAAQKRLRIRGGNIKRCGLVAALTCALCILSACSGGTSGPIVGSGASGTGSGSGGASGTGSGSGSGGAGGTGGGGGAQVATHFALTAPATASASTFFTLTVSALDNSNSSVGGYSGTVHFTSTDHNARFPPDSTLTQGTVTISVALTSPGIQTITATDTVTAGITGSSMPISIATNSDPRGFQPTGDLGTERAAHAATLLANGTVLITGGYSYVAGLATAELYDPATGTFSSTGAMTIRRLWHTATLLANGKVLVAGGSSDSATSELFNSGDLATAELYDPATGTFTATGTMSEVRSEHTATLLANGKVLVACGAADNVAELFDPATGSFTPTPGKLTTGGRWGCTATLLNDGTVLIAGGRDTENVYDAYPLNDAELFNPATGTFTSTGQMTDYRYHHTATLLKNGEVLVTGGFNGSPTSSAELFDPTAGSFLRTGPMDTPRAQHTSTLLDDGTVLVAGAFTYASPGSLSSAEVFDPKTNTFGPAGPMGVARFSHTATRLNSGQVLVTGGESNFNFPGVFASSANLYK